MTDKILLTGLSAFGHHGVLPQERRDGQTFVVDLALDVDLLPAAIADDLNLTVDYGSLAVAVTDLITGEPVDLIETLAERIAQRCLDFAAVARVVVTVHKPQAPIPVPFADVAVQVMRTRKSAGTRDAHASHAHPPNSAGPAADGGGGASGDATVAADPRDEPAASPAVGLRAALGIGANLGDRRAALDLAVQRIRADPAVASLRVSRYYDSTPVGGPADQPDYLNAVVVLDAVAGISAPELAERLLLLGQAVERELHRVRLERWGPRTVDVDVLAVADHIGDDPRLTVPHPRLAERAFVLVPWAEVDSGFVVPGKGTVADLLRSLNSAEVSDVRPIDPADGPS